MKYRLSYTGASNEYHNICFCEGICKIFILIPSYLELCNTLYFCLMGNKEKIEKSQVVKHICVVKIVLEGVNKLKSWFKNDKTLKIPQIM